MTLTPKSIALYAAILIAVGILIGSSFDCHGQSVPSPLPGRPPTQRDTTTNTVYVSGVTHYSDTGSYRVDTAYVKAPFWLIDTVYTEKPQPATPAFSLPGTFTTFAPALIAAFKPATPRNFLEVWLHAGHDFLNGGYSGGIEGDVNLDQIRLSNATLYGDLGYDHSLHFTLGVRGKLYGAY